MNVVVTGGGTIAPIDDVRYIANVSSGRLSAAITEACVRRGANVWHVHAPSAQLPFLRSARFDLDAPDQYSELGRLARLRREWESRRGQLRLVPIGGGTVGEYAESLRRLLETEAIDVAFLTMAVSDFEPEPFAGKLDSDTESVIIRGRRTPKIIQSVREWAPAVYLVGFKLLSRVSEAELIREARSACETNRADLTVANDLQTLRDGRHTLHLVRPNHPPETLAPDGELGDRLVERVFAWSAARGQ